MNQIKKCKSSSSSSSFSPILTFELTYIRKFPFILIEEINILSIKEKVKGIGLFYFFIGKMKINFFFFSSYDFMNQI